MAAVVHKTLSFVTGAGLAYLGYMSLSNLLVFNTNKTYNKIVSSSESANMMGLQPLPESKDYVDYTIKTTKRLYNNAILKCYGWISTQLSNETPMSIRLYEYYESKKSK